MPGQSLVLALALTTAGLDWSSDLVTGRARQDVSPWLRTESRHFEIHCPPALVLERDSVVRSAERAYDRISRRLNFVLATKVPLVMFSPSGQLTRDQVVAYAVSDEVAPQQPHRSRIVLPIAGHDAQLDALIVHELAHLLVSEIILPGRGGDGGVPRWVHEGLARYMAGVWGDDDKRLMGELVVSGHVPALSQLIGSGGFANARLNDLIGHAAFDYIEGRWGVAGIRRFVNALIVPRVDKTYDGVVDLTPAEFDAAFLQYAVRRFTPVAR